MFAVERESPQQPVVKVWLHSTGDASSRGFRLQPEGSASMAAGYNR
jgi:hypothetical protein